MLAYFFALRYITKLYKCQKGNFALVVLRNVSVTRFGGGLQSRAKNKAPFEKLRLADFSIMGAMVLLEFRFLALGGVWKLPRRFAKGWMEYATPALQVVIVPYLLGSTRELGTV